MKKILGIGNALVDIMTTLESDSTLKRLNLPKGSMQLVSSETMISAIDTTKGLRQQIAAGGSAANTINGLSKLGVATSFIGKIGSDEMGEFFRNDMINNKINPMLLVSTTATGKALALVSPDSERTFAVNLGAAIELSPNDLTYEMFDGFDCLHIEGYLVQNHALIQRALEISKQLRIRVSLDLASFNVVEANKDFLWKMVEDYVDIIFANEEEAKAFTGKSPEDSLGILSELVDIAVVKIGAAGSMIKSNNQVYKVGVVKANCIDTTGAGDLYASGFLYGLSKNLSLDLCGEIGAVLSGKVIEHIGPKMPDSVWIELKNTVSKILGGHRFTK